MKADDEVCVCFHVTFRKLINFMRQRQVRRPSELSECFGAGTGCGWCRPVLRRLAETPAEQLPQPEEVEAWVSERYPELAQDYTTGRSQYRESRQKD